MGCGGIRPSNYELKRENEALKEQLENVTLRRENAAELEISPPENPLYNPIYPMLGYNQEVEPLSCIIAEPVIATAVQMPLDPPIYDSLMVEIPNANDDLSSKHSDNPCTVTFINNLPRGHDVQVRWVGYNKTEELYKTLHPGKKHKQRTFLTHPWKLYDMSGGGDGVCIKVFIAHVTDDQSTTYTVYAK